MLGFAITSTVERVYKRKTAKVSVSFWVSLDEDDKIKLYQYLKRFGYELDENVCWRNKDGICFHYSDNSLGLGTEIIEKKNF